MSRHIGQFPGHVGSTTIRLVEQSAGARSMHIEMIRLTGACCCGSGCNNRGRDCAAARSTLINSTDDGDTSLTWAEVLRALPASVLARLPPAAR